MAEPFTHALWKIKPGRANEFVTAWESFAAWAREQTPGILWGVLLRDSEDANLFASTGAWDQAEDIALFVENPGTQQRLEGILQLVESFDARTMELVAVRDPDEWDQPPFAR
jgi:heme-degrading monooxygenase HmoA